MARDLPRLYLVTDRARLGEEALLGAVEATARAGLCMVQVREKELALEEVRRLVGRCRAVLPEGALVIAGAAGRPPGFARLVGADGAHLPGAELARLDAVRRVLPAPFILGYSAHAEAEIAEAARRGADYVSLAPVFAPWSKASAAPPLGLEALRRACEHAPVPVYAQGGIDAARAALARAAGAYGVSVIGAILDAPDPEEAAREILRACGGT